MKKKSKIGREEQAGATEEVTEEATAKVQIGYFQVAMERKSIYNKKQRKLKESAKEH